MFFIDPLHIEAIVPIDLLGKIQKDMVLLVKPEKPLTDQYEAKVTIVDPMVDAASGTFRVRLELPNEGGHIPPGLKCRLQF